MAPRQTRNSVYGRHASPVPSTSASFPAVPTTDAPKEPESCLICHQQFNTGDEPEFAITLPCGHTIGFVCATQWLLPSRTHGCLLCQQNPFFHNPNNNNLAAGAELIEAAGAPNDPPFPPLNEITVAIIYRTERELLMRPAVNGRLDQIIEHVADERVELRDRAGVVHLVQQGEQIRAGDGPIQGNAMMYQMLRGPSQRVVYRAPSTRLGKFIEDHTSLVGGLLITGFELCLDKKYHRLLVLWTLVCAEFKLVRFWDACKSLGWRNASAMWWKTLTMRLIVTVLVLAGW